MSTDSNTRETTVTWTDTSQGLSLLPTMDGIDFLRKMASGEVPGAPIGAHIGMQIAEVDEGTVTFHCHPDESHYNPIGMVHGPLVRTGRDTEGGRRVAFAEGEVVDNKGKTVATAPGSLLIFPLEAK